MTVANNPVDPNQIDVGYDTSTCNASNHTVFYGLLGDYSTVITADCSIGNGGSVTTTPPPGNVWLLAGVDAQCPTVLSQDVSAICP
jgi:hypothetical protein